MEINTERVGDALVAKAWRRIDSVNARDFENALKSVISESDRVVVVDFQELSYISSAGLRAVLIIAKVLRNRNAAFAVCALSDPVRAVFEISGFDKIIPIHPSPEAAVAALAG